MNRTSEEIAWAAGIIDGDGSMGIYNYASSEAMFPQIRLEMTHEPTVDRFAEILGAYTGRGKHEAAHKKTYRCTIQGTRVARVISELTPYLISRTRQVDILRRFCQTMLTPRDRCLASGGNVEKLRPEVLNVRRQLRAEIMVENRPGADFGDFGTEAIRAAAGHRLDATQSKTHRAWLAGFFDAEGCVHIGVRRKPPAIRHYYSGHDRNYLLIVTVTNTNPRMIAEVNRIAGGCITARRTKIGTPFWTWTRNSRPAAEFLRAIQPYSVTKTAQIALGLEFAETLLPKSHGKSPPGTIEQRAKLYTKMHELNRRGV